jgi:aminoglycoside 3-N-acetyltransferase I
MDSREAAIDSVTIRRLGLENVAEACRLFQTIASVFEEDSKRLPPDYVKSLLGSPSFWAIGAFAGNEVLGGLTAHTLPMTRSADREVFLYDIAVREEWRRRGIGRRLVEFLREAAAAETINVMFVPADNEDLHALDFYRALGGEASPVTVFTFASDDAV